MFNKLSVNTLENSSGVSLIGLGFPFDPCIEKASVKKECSQIILA